MGLAEAPASAILTAYFELSYRLLDSTAGRLLLEAAAEPGAPPVHGYTDLADLDLLIEALEPGPGSSILDLGAGLGDVATWLHRATGARVVGLERSRRAVAAARRRAVTAGVGDDVRFVVGDIMRRLPSASAAYALDSLMFAARPGAAIATIAGRLRRPARLFATVIVVGPGDAASLRRSLASGTLRIVRLEDVSAAMTDRSRRRRSIARQLVSAQRRGHAGRGALLLVCAEETLLLGLARMGLARRYRVIVDAGPVRDPGSRVPAAT